MATSGILDRRPDHLRDLADFALAVEDVIHTINATYGTSFLVRMGMDVGPAVAGVIGRTKVRTVSHIERTQSACMARS